MDLEPKTEVIVPDELRTQFQLIEDDQICRISIKATSEKRDRRLVRKFEDFEESLLESLQQGRAKYQISLKSVEIRNALRALPDHPVAMSWDEYVAFCEGIRPKISEKREGTDESMLDTLTGYLHEIGVVLYYPRIEALRKKIFVKPKLVTDAIYRVLDYSVIQNEGRFNFAHVKKLSGDIDSKEMVALLEEFELVFRVHKTTDEFVAPQYLPAFNKEADTKSYKMNEEKCAEIILIALFPFFLPKSVITRFICRFGNLSSNNFWENGMLFVWNGISTLMERTGDNTISIRAERVDLALAQEMFNTLWDLSDEDEKLQISVNGQTFVEAKHIKKAPKDNQQLPTVDGEWVEKLVFSRFFSKRMNQYSAQPKNPRGFVSYARAEDRRYMGSFLKGINSHAEWETFDDRQILLGEDWHKRLQKEVQECDFGILLLSPNFFRSDYIRDHEFEQFIERNLNEGFPIFSVLLVDCNYTKWGEVARRQFFSAEGQDYGLAHSHRDKQISFDLLIETDAQGEIKLNPHRNQFCKNFVAKVDEALKKI